jgi:hypothetical protein
MARKFLSVRLLFAIADIMSLYVTSDLIDNTDRGLPVMKSIITICNPLAYILLMKLNSS